MTSLDELLDSLALGKLDSQGAFTLSEQTAREKLARYTLVHPSLYLLELVSVAVLGGATLFEIETPGGDTRLRFDGAKVTSSFGRHSLGQLFSSATDARASCLGLALTAAHSGAGRELKLRLSDGAFVFDGQSLIPDPESEASPLFELLVPGRFGLFGACLRREATLKELMELCTCTPLRVRLDGTELLSGWRPPRLWNTGALLHWQNPDYPLSWGSGTVNPTVTLPSPGDFSMLLAFKPLEDPAQGIRIVHQGVCYRAHATGLDLPGVCAVINSGGLRRNLSRSEIVVDQHFEALMKLVQQGTRLLADAVVVSPYRYSSRTRGAPAPLRWAFHQATEEQSAALRSWLAVLDFEKQTPMTPQSLAELADHRQALGESQDAQNLRLRALEQVIDRLRAWSPERNLGQNFAGWMTELRSLSRFLEGTPRADTMTQLLALAAPLAGEMDGLDGPMRLLGERLLGRPDAAAKLLPGWSDFSLDFGFRVPVEVRLAQGRLDLALRTLLDNYAYATVEDALEDDWPVHRGAAVDLLADILELQNDPRALTARRLCLSACCDNEMRLYRLLELCRHTRCKGRWADWLAHRALASVLDLAVPSLQVSALQAQVPSMIADLLEDGLLSVKRLDELFLPLCDKHTRFCDAFPYLLGRLAQRLRLAGELIRADQVLARGYTLRAMERVLGNLG